MSLGPSSRANGTSKYDFNNDKGMMNRNEAWEWDVDEAWGMGTSGRNNIIKTSNYPLVKTKISFIIQNHNIRKSFSMKLKPYQS